MSTLVALYITALLGAVLLIPLPVVVAVHLVLLMFINRWCDAKATDSNRPLYAHLLIFVAVPLIWSTTAIVLRCDWSLVSGTIKEGLYGGYIGIGLKSLFREYRIELRSLCEAFSLLTMLMVAVVVQKLLVLDSRKVKIGILAGLLIVGIFSLFLAITNQFIGTQTNLSFWQAMNRVSGMCSDPNSLGIFSFFAIALAFTLGGDKKLMKWALIFCYLLLGFLSGSRTFVLGLSLLIFIQGLLIFDRRKRLGILLGVTIFVLLFVYTISFLNLESLRTTAWIPEGIQRTLVSIHPMGFAESVSSRALFWKLSFYKFLENPIFGVGFNQFERGFAEFSNSLGINLNGWIDNPNSFYLGILAEQGIIGALVLCSGFYFVRFRPLPGVSTGVCSVAIFLFLLFFGPHLDFLEVSLLFGILLGISFKIESRKISSKITMSVLVVLLMIIFGGSLSLLHAKDFGTFSRNKKLFLRSNAKVTMKCSEGMAFFQLSIPGGKTDEKASVYLTSAKQAQQIEVREDTAQVHLACQGPQIQVDFRCTPIRIPNKPDLLRGVRPFCVAIDR